MRSAPAALVLLVCAVARAGDQPPKIDLRTPTQWKPGEVVTASVMESTQTTLSGRRSGADPMPMGDVGTKLEARFVLRCLDADPQGKLLRSLVHIDAWSRTDASREDRSLEGALIEVSSTGWSLVAVPANPSRLARHWLDNRFGTGGRGFSGGLAELGSSGPVAPGESWTADPPVIAKGLAEGALPIQPKPRKWRFVLAEVGSSPAGATAKVTFDETLPVNGEASSDGKTIMVAEGSSVHAHGEFSGVPGLWHRTGRMDTVAEDDLDTSSGGMAVRLHVVCEEREEWGAGGTAPGIPAPETSGGALSIGGVESWSVGDTVLESGREHGTEVATPVDDGGKEGAAERSDWTVTWSAEVECTQAFKDHWPRELVVVLRAWAAMDGEKSDDSLKGAVLRVDEDGFRITSGGEGASARAKAWLRTHYAAGAGRDDALRAAMTPAMPVAPRQGWASDPEDTASALRGRFGFPLDAGSIHGKGTLVRVQGTGAPPNALIAYEVQAAISCVPGCNGAGADVMKGTVHVKGSADGPPAQWTRLGSFQDVAEVSVTLPGQEAGEDLRRLSITQERRVARAPLADAGRSAQSWTQAAVAKIDRRDFDGAIEDCTKAIGIDPRFQDAWFNCARARAGRHDAAGAIADYTTAIEIAPGLPASYNNRGYQKFSTGDVDGAIADYSKAIEVSPRFALSYWNRGLAKAGRGDFEGAIADYDKAIEIRPKYTEAYNDRGVAHYKRHEYAAAAEDYTSAAALAPKESLYLVNRGNAKSAQGDLAGSLADHDAAIALNPANARAFYFRADVRSRKGDAAGALEDYARAIELDPKFGSNWNDRGILRLDQGDVEGALADFTRAIELDPRDRHAVYNRARAKWVRADCQGAIEDCTRSIEIDPRYAAAYTRRGSYRQETGDEGGAIADWMKAIEADPRYAPAHAALAWAGFLPGLPLAPVVEELRTAIAAEDDRDYDHLWLWLTRAWSAEEQAATKELQDYAAARKPVGSDEWYPVIIDLLTGKKGEDAAIAAAASSDAKTGAERLCEATFYAGMLRAVRGDVAKAVELLDRCIATNVRNFTEFSEARRWRPALMLGGSTRAADGGAGRIVVSPDPRGPLARAGLRGGDRITGIDGNPLAPGQLEDLLLKARPGTLTHFDVDRAGATMRADVNLGVWRSK